MLSASGAAGSPKDRPQEAGAMGFQAARITISKSVYGPGCVFGLGEYNMSSWGHDLSVHIVVARKMRALPTIL